MPKVSVVIPVYNVEEYLVECMDSIVGQSLRDIEIICINDGSTDGSLDILKEYAEADSRIVLVDKENGGYGVGMNIGLEKATGEYIGILEPDDYVPANMFGDLYGIARANDLDFVKADFYRFKRAENGNMELVYNHLSGNPEDYNVVFNPSEDPQRLRYIMNTWSGIYKRSFIEEHHIRHNETPGASYQDNGFWFQTFIYATRAMIVDKPYYMNRRDNPNSSMSNPGKVYCANIEYDHIRDILMQDQKLWEKFKYMYWVKRYHNCITTLGRIAIEFKWEYVQRMSGEFKRAMQKNELSEEEFTNISWLRIQLLVRNPKGYFETYVVPGENARELMRVRAENENLRREVEALRGCASYRIGRVLMFIPGKIKRLFKHD